MPRMIRLRFFLLCGLAIVCLVGAGIQGSPFDANAVRKTGAQSMEGTLTITTATQPALSLTGTATGNSAIQIPTGATICLDGATCTETIRRSASGFITLNSSLILNGASTNSFSGPLTIAASGGLLNAGTLDQQGTVFNTTSNNGGAIAINDVDGLRWTSASVGAILQSQLVSGTAFSFRNSAGTEQAAIQTNGAFTAAGITTNAGADAGGIAVNLNGTQSGYLFHSSASASFKMRSNTANGATAIGTALDTANSFSTAGAKLLSFQNATVEKGFVALDGAIEPGSVATASLRATCTNGELVWDSTTSTHKRCLTNAWATIGAPGAKNNPTLSGYSPLTSGTAPIAFATFVNIGETVVTRSITWQTTATGVGTGNNVYALFDDTASAIIASGVTVSCTAVVGTAVTVDISGTALVAANQYSLRLHTKSDTCTTYPTGNLTVTLGKAY